MKTFDGCTLNQGFGENANGAYAAYKGHPGVDTACGYGTDILSPVTGVVSALYTPEKPASDGYVAVYILVQTKLETFEYNVGHCSKVFVKLGDKVTKGQLIAQEGNKGLVYQGDTLITLAMQKAGDKRGAHRHNQKRPLHAVLKRATNGEYLTNSKGYFRGSNGEYYEYALPYREYASCVNFLLPLFHSTLQKGSEGYEVKLLQKAIGVPEDLQTGYFGDYTDAKLRSFQLSNGLESVGICGPKTRDFLNARYGQLEDPVLPVTPVVLPTIDSVLEDFEENIQATPPDTRSAWEKLLEQIRTLFGK